MVCGYLRLSIVACDRRQTDRQTHTQSHMYRLVMCNFVLFSENE